MDAKKFLSFEHLFSSSTSLSFKSRVLSGFCVGVLASLLLFSLLLCLTPTPTPSSPSAFSWFFSITNSSLLLAHADNSSSFSAADNSDLGMTHFMNLTVDANISLSWEEEPLLGKTHDGNSSTSPISRNPTADLNSSSGLVHQEPILEPTHDGVGQVNENAPLELDNSKRVFEKEEEGRSVQVQGSNKDDGGKINVSQATSDSNSTNAKEEIAGTCNIFNGRWVRDDREPFYPAGSCPYIDNDFNCHKNGRPDDEFLKWRWQPNDCNIPSLNATDFLVRLKGKRLLFVGDSLNRNMWESLVCILRHSVKRKERVYEASGSHDFKTKGYYSFRFKDYNCSVDFVRSTFLVREIFFKNANGSDDERLRLDLLDETTSAYREADIIVFNTGHWWTHEKTSRGIHYYQEGDHVYPVLKAMEAYKKALTTWARWVDKNINSSKTEVVYRGYSLTHFRGGQWNSGGQCHKETEPIFNESFLAKYPSKMRALERVLDQMKTPVIYLNISRLTDYRKDGHPSIYRKTYKTVEEQVGAEQSQDCSHWCLPGIPDTWNELLYTSLLLNGKGSWTR